MKHMKHYLAIKRNGVFILAITWINPENIMLSEKRQRSQTQKVTYVIPFIGSVHNAQIHRDRK